MNDVLGNIIGRDLQPGSGDLRGRVDDVLQSIVGGSRQPGSGFGGVPVMTALAPIVAITTTCVATSVSFPPTTFEK